MNDLIDLDFYNPDTVSPFETENSNKYRFITIINHQFQRLDIQLIIQVFIQLNEQYQNTELIIYIQNTAASHVDNLMVFLNKELAKESADIVCIQEDIIPDKLFFAQILKGCHCLIDLTANPDSNIIFQAMAMNLQIILSKNSHVNELYSDFLCKYSAPSQADLFEALVACVSGQKSNPCPRSSLIFHLSKASLEWSNTWFQANVNAAVTHFPSIKLTSILFWGRSGSTFIHSLLDGHPELLSIGASNFSAVTEYPLYWSILLTYKPNSFAEIINIFCNMIDSSSEICVNKSCSIFSEKNQNFKAVFISFCHQIINHYFQIFGEELVLQEVRKTFFIVIHFAYALALGQDVRHKKQIIHQLHWAEDLVDLYRLLEDFPDLKIIGMMRHPVQGLYSSLYHSLIEQQKNEPDYSFSDMVYSGFYAQKYRHILMGWRRAESLLQTPVKCIRLESLHEAPQTVLSDLCNWLEIEWNDSLLLSTQDGNGYEVSSGIHTLIRRDQPVFSPERVNYTHWKESIGDVEKFVLEGLLQKVLNDQGIEKISDFQHYLSHILLFLPNKIEVKAFLNALNPASLENFKSVILAILERYYFSWLLLCNYVYPVNPSFAFKMSNPTPFPEHIQSD